MTEEQLEMYKEFRGAYDYKEKACDLNTSCEVMYEVKGCGQYELDEEVLKEVEYDSNGIGHIDGYFVIEAHPLHSRNVDVIHVPVTFDLEDFDEEEQVFNSESYSVHDIEEWY